MSIQNGNRFLARVKPARRSLDPSERLVRAGEGGSSVFHSWQNTMCKKTKHILRFILVSSCWIFLLSAGEDRFTDIEKRLSGLSKDNPGLTGKIDVSVNGITIQEFLRTVASQNNLNVTIDPAINIKVVHNFYNVSVTDVFLFLCRKYDLDIDFTGNILSFAPYNAPPLPPPVYSPKPLKITYDNSAGLVSIDLSGDSLNQVTRELSRITGKNILYAPDQGSKLINGYIQNSSLANTLDKLSFVNDFRVSMPDSSTFLIEKRDKETTAGLKNSKGLTGSKQTQPGVSVKLEHDSLVSVEAVNSSISEVLSAVSKELNIDYFLFSEPKGNASLKITRASFDDFLNQLFNGTDLTYRNDSGLYLIGDRSMEGLRYTEVVKLKYRTFNKIIDVIPADLKKNVDIKPFADQNSIILSGSYPAIKEIESFLRKVDQVVPVIVIEVLIVDVRDTRTLSSGIEAGLSSQPIKTEGKVYPSIDLTLSSASINEIISGINGFGIVNLGSVTPQFYMKLRALEEQGILKLRSTPRLSTLNGNEATMTIGKTEVYLEETNNVIGNLNTQTIVTKSYKTVNADFSLTVNPIVSGDEQITLEIKVKQSTFTERISPSAPPGTISREFKSMIRAKNNEMIILGGLEENTTNDSGSGVPLLSRIPVIKWLFSSRTKSKNQSKLTVFIKPTVIY